MLICILLFFSKNPCRGRRARGRILVGLTTTCSISAYHH